MSTRTRPPAPATPATSGRARASQVPRAGTEATPRRSTPRATVAAVLAALALGALLNGPGLISAATGMEVGATRTVALRVATAIADAGALLRLDRPQQWAGMLRDRVGFGATSSGPGAAAGGGGSTPQDLGAAGAASLLDVPDAAHIPFAPGREHDRSRRPVTAEQPLQVLLVGDSLIGTIADGFGRRTDGRERIRWHKDVRISTGLARPDVLDWHDHLQRQLATHDPDVVVLMLGGNDDQSLTGAPGGVIHLGDEAWAAEYERRVTDLLTIADGQDRLVVWLGLPAVRPAKLERARVTMRAAAERAIAGTQVVLLDTAPIVSPGGYTARLDGAQVRADDGVHLSHAGGDRVAARLDQLLVEHYDLPGG